MPVGSAREQLEVFIADQLARWKAATVSQRYRALAQFFKCLDAEGEIKIANPPTPPARHASRPRST